ASSIEANNDRRIIRALEVIELTGKPFTASMPKPTYVYPTRQFSLDVEQDVLDERVAKRVQQMWNDGLVEETSHLLSEGLERGVTASRAVGYAQTIRYLAGELSDGEARDEIALATRQLARRQRRWFARDKRIEKLPGDDRAQAMAVLLSALRLYDSDGFDGSSLCWTLNTLKPLALPVRSTCQFLLSQLCSESAPR